MPLLSLLYVSRCTIAQRDAAEAVNQIVATAAARNPVLGLTGALLFTGVQFAQVLEGDDASIDQLMAAVVRDPRHDRMLIVERGLIDKRRFADWSMAYFGPSKFVSRHVTRLLNHPSPVEHRRGADWLNDLLREFSAKAFSVF